MINNEIILTKEGFLKLKEELKERTKVIGKMLMKLFLLENTLLVMIANGTK